VITNGSGRFPEPNASRPQNGNTLLSEMRARGGLVDSHGINDSSSATVSLVSASGSSSVGLIPPASSAEFLSQFRAHCDNMGGSNPGSAVVPGSSVVSGSTALRPGSAGVPSGSGLPPREGAFRLAQPRTRGVGENASTIGSSTGSSTPIAHDLLGQIRARTVGESTGASALASFKAMSNQSRTPDHNAILASIRSRVSSDGNPMRRSFPRAGPTNRFGGGASASESSSQPVTATSRGATWDENVVQESTESVQVSAALESALNPPVPPPNREVTSSNRQAAHRTAGDLDAPNPFGVECPICLDMPASGNLASTVCGHLFCLSCISQVTEEIGTCPRCRRQLCRDDYHRIFM